MSQGNWIRIQHDDRKSLKDDGFLYSCKEGHSWFLTFPEIESIVEENRRNDCKECAEVNAPEAV